jgi:hypothetical protein
MKLSSRALLLLASLMACSSVEKIVVAPSVAPPAPKCDPESPPYKLMRSLAYLGRASQLRDLLRSGVVDVNCQYSDEKWKGYTILMAAATNGWPKTTENILAFKPDLNIASELVGGCHPGTAYILTKYVARNKVTTDLLQEYADKHYIDIDLKTQDCPPNLEEAFKNTQAMFNPPRFLPY